MILIVVQFSAVVMASIGLSNLVDKIKSNYYVSVIINLIYLILTIPAIFMMNNGMFCKYYSIIFFLAYFLFYKMVHEKTK